MENAIEKIEIWIPCKNGEGQAWKNDGTQMKLAVILVGGTPIFLEKDYQIHKSYLTKEQANHLLTTKD